MENELFGIGKVASLSGLPVSALRFYDGAGVLVPHAVDAASGYRFYAPEQVRAARLVAHLRRVGLPLDGIRAVLTEPSRAGAVLDDHLARLEAGLADARREISIVHELLETQENPMYRCTLPAAALTAALRAVRHAVSTDPDQTRLHGVQLDGEGDRLRLVATDRFRLATSIVETHDAAGLHLLLPTAAVDELLAADPRDEVEVRVADGCVVLSGGWGSVTAEVPDADFPPYRSLLEAGRREVPLDAVTLRAALDDDGDPIARLAIGEAGVTLAAGGEGTPVAVNRRFLLDALAMGDQLVLGFDDPIAPLAIRGADGSGSVIMPMRLDQPA